ncbi:hypothetical protein AB0K16_22330 [Nonomuraea jabiensis]|uniref:hypothetical protein n=1 Tax=Nonomuraea jabiensis TaxID=882448 RepID=UPI0034223621
MAHSLDTYIGIDQSVGGFGLVFLTPGSGLFSAFVEKFPLAKYDGKEMWQLDAVENFIIEKLARFPERIKSVAREGFSYGSQQGREKAGALAYAVDRTLYGWLAEPACYPIVIQPTTVKKFATNNGGATKDEMVAAVEEHWHVELSDHNAADAYVLSRIAYGLDTDIVETDYQAEVLEDIRNPTKKTKKKRPKKLSVLTSV